MCEDWKARAERAEAEAKRLRADVSFLVNLLPLWAINAPRPRNDPTMYGTGCYEGDCGVYARVCRIKEALRRARGEGGEG